MFCRSAVCWRVSAWDRVEFVFLAYVLAWCIIIFLLTWAPLGSRRLSWALLGPPGLETTLKRTAETVTETAIFMCTKRNLSSIIKSAKKRNLCRKTYSGGPRHQSSRTLHILACCKFCIGMVCCWKCVCLSLRKNYQCKFQCRKNSNGFHDLDLIATQPYPPMHINVRKSIKT